MLLRSEEAVCMKEEEGRWGRSEEEEADIDTKNVEMEEVNGKEIEEMEKREREKYNGLGGSES